MLTTVIVAVGTALPMTTEAGKEATLEQQVRGMESFGMTGDRPDVRADARADVVRALSRRRIGVLIFSPIIALASPAFCFAVFNAAMGGEASFKQVFAVLVHAGRDLGAAAALHRAAELLPRRRRSATNLGGAAADARPRSRSSAGCSAMIDLFLIWCAVRPGDRAGGALPAPTQPIAIALFGVYAGDRAGDRRRHEPCGGSMSRKKKILIGVGIVVVLGADRVRQLQVQAHRGITVNTEAIQKRDLEAIVSASGKIQPKRFVNISADTMGRVTELAVNEGDRVKKGQFLLQIDPRNLRTRGRRAARRRSARRSRAPSSCGWRSRARARQLKQAQDNYKRQQELWKGGLTTREALERAESELTSREAGPARPGAERPHAAAAHASRKRRRSRAPSTDLSKVRIESPIDGIVTRRNIERVKRPSSAR